MRIFIGFLVIALALSLGFWLHDGPEFGSVTVSGGWKAAAKASWQDPLAILVAVTGLGAGIAIALPGFRR